MNSASRHPQLLRDVFELKVEPVARDDSDGRLDYVISIDASSFAPLALWRRLNLVLDLFFSFVMAGTHHPQRPGLDDGSYLLPGCVGHRRRFSGEDLQVNVPRVRKSVARSKSRRSALWSDAAATAPTAPLNDRVRTPAPSCYARILPLLIFGSKGISHAGTARLSEPKATFRPSRLTSKKSRTPVFSPVTRQLPVGDRFRRTASATMQSRQTDAVSGSTETLAISVG